MKSIKNFFQVIDKQLLVYFSLLAILLIVVLIASRFVLFKPWTARNWISTASNNEHVYIVGGIDMHNNPEKDILHIDLQKKTLKRVGDLPTARYSTASTFISPYIYITGGRDNNGYIDEIIQYNPDKKTSEVFSRFEKPRCFGTLIASRNFLYYLGGFDGEKVLDSIVKINIETGIIEQSTTLPDPVNFHAAAAVGNNIIVAGGENKSMNAVQDIYEIDPDTGEILRSGKLPFPLLRSTLTVFDNYLYILGGWGKGPMKEIIRINLETPELRAEVIGLLPEGSSDTSLVTHNSKLYLFGGEEGIFKRQIKILEYDPETGNLESINLKSYAWR